MSHSDIIRLYSAEAKKAIVAESSSRSIEEALTYLTIDMLREDAGEDLALREELAGVASVKLGLSNRKIAALLGLSHPTVSKAVGSYLARNEVGPHD
jgi:hypothetical protein